MRGNLLYVVQQLLAGFLAGDIVRELFFFPPEFSSFWKLRNLYQEMEGVRPPVTFCEVLQQREETYQPS